MRFLGTILAFSMAASADCIRVEGEFIRVADVPQAPASGLAAEEVLLRAPAAGVRRTVEGAEMRRLLRLPEDAPAIPPVCFEQVTERLSQERILEAMRKNFPGRDLSIRATPHINPVIAVRATAASDCSGKIALTKPSCMEALPLYQFVVAIVVELADAVHPTGLSAEIVHCRPATFTMTAEHGVTKQ